MILLDLLGLLLGIVVIAMLALLLTPTVIGVVWLVRHFSRQPARRPQENEPTAKPTRETNR